MECSSHDQGWASGEGEVGWTWSDLVVKNVEGVEVHREQRVFVNPRANKQFQLSFMSNFSTSNQAL